MTFVDKQIQLRTFRWTERVCIHIFILWNRSVFFLIFLFIPTNFLVRIPFKTFFVKSFFFSLFFFYSENIYFLLNKISEKKSEKKCKLTKSVHSSLHYFSCQCTYNMQTVIFALLTEKLKKNGKNDKNNNHQIGMDVDCVWVSGWVSVPGVGTRALRL